MATAALSAAMSLEGKDVVHPFFRKARTSATPAIEELPTPEGFEHHQVTSEPQQPPADARPAACEPNGSGSVKHPSGSTGPRQATLDAFSLPKIVLPQAEPPSSYTPAANVYDTGSTLDEDLNHLRRKRQRTASPEGNAGRSRTPTGEPRGEVSGPNGGFQLSWKEQLRSEAAKSCDAVTTAEVALEPAGGDILNQEAAGTCIIELRNADGPDHFGSLGTGTSDAVRGAGSSADQERDTTAAESYAAAAAAPHSKPAKLLKLKNGRLASPPKPRAEPPQSEPEKRTRPRRQKKQVPTVPTLPVIIKYPENSLDTAKLGARIENILNGSERYQSPPQKLVTMPKISANQSSGPPKSTHPFFMGKAALKAATESDTSPDAIKKVEAKVPSPRKLTGTPGKIRAEAEAHRATLKPPAFGHVFGSFQPRITKYPGMREAPFPWRGTAHSRGLTHITEATGMILDGEQCELPITRRKLKHALVAVNESEDLIHLCARELHSSRPSDSLRRPQKVITTGPGIQSQIVKELRVKFGAEKSDCSDSEGPAIRRRSQQNAPHPALQAMYAGIEKELTPFDKYECEAQAWTHKYAPCSALEVLQSGKEATILRDWLRSTTITAVDTGNAVASSKTDKVKPEKKKKKRKRVEDLDDFIVESEDELVGAGELTELEDEESAVSRSLQQRSLVRAGRFETASKLGNAVLLSGPNGCGKTAAAYAVAKELGFEVFELNSGSRRSGKDVLDKIGDMTENHLVQQVSKALSENKSTEKLEAASIVENDVDHVKQGSVTSFFKPSAKKTPVPVKVNQAAKTTEKTETKQQPRQQQRQSVILLEEVDVLFEEDKQFWVTVLALAGNSKRPIIMTCNDESRLPIHALSLYAILRFTPPPTDLAVDYLLLLAAREGHLLKRNVISSLYKSRGRDLRGSVMDLDHWCQMGVGDSTGGFGWMLDRYPPGVDLDEQGLTMRVASTDTYLAGMGLLSHDLACSTSRVGFDKDEALLLEALHHYDLQVDNFFVTPSHIGDSMVSGLEKTNLALLQKLEREAEFGSSLDVSSGLGLRTGYEQSIDPTLSELSEKVKANYIADMGLVHADPVPDYPNFNRHLAIGTSLRFHREICATNVLRQHENTTDTIANNVLAAILNHASTIPINTPLSRKNFSAAFDPLAEPSATSTQPVSHSYPLLASSFDREFSVTVLDLAPYVRGIAAYDLNLEAERLKLSSLLSAGGRGTKKLRTTRASRSAVEGGRRETTRRERWFDKNVHLGNMLETGGREWGKSSRPDEGGSTREGSVLEGSTREESGREESEVSC